MLLSKKADTLINQIIEVETANERKRKRGELEVLSGKLSQINLKVDSCIEIEHLIGHYEEEVNFNNIRSELNKLKSILKYEQNDERIIARINTNIEEIKLKLKYVWIEYSEKQTEGTRRVLKNIRPFFQQIDQNEIERLINDLEKARDVWPLNETRYNKFKKDIDLAKVKIAQLDLTEEIRNFIQKTSENKATLIDLTPDILEWLKENKYENRIKLKF